MRHRDRQGRFAYPPEPDLGPYWIEAPNAPADWRAPNSCCVVNVRRPLPDPLNEGGKGFETVFTGTFAECDAWMEANPFHNGRDLEAVNSPSRRCP